jgi:hypothetical protein
MSCEESTFRPTSYESAHGSRSGVQVHEEAPSTQVQVHKVFLRFLFSAHTSRRGTLSRPANPSRWEKITFKSQQICEGRYGRDTWQQGRARGLSSGHLSPVVPWNMSGGSHGRRRCGRLEVPLPRCTGLIAWAARDPQSREPQIFRDHSLCQLSRLEYHQNGCVGRRLSIRLVLWEVQRPCRSRCNDRCAPDSCVVTFSSMLLKGLEGFRCASVGQTRLSRPFNAHSPK